MRSRAVRAPSFAVMTLFAAGLSSCVTHPIHRDWAAPVLISAAPGEAVESFSPVAIDGAGHAVVAWFGNGSWHYTRLDAPRNGSIRSVAIDAANGIGASRHVISAPDGLALLHDGSGNPRLLPWSSDMARVHAALYSAASASARNPLGLRIELHPAGFGVAVWHHPDQTDEETQYHVWAIRYRPDAGVTDAEMLSEPAADALEPTAAVAANGDTIVAWRQFDGEDYSLFAARHRLERGWEAPIAIESHADEAVYPQLAVDAAGNALAVWVQRDCDPTRRCVYSHVWANRLVATRGWGPAERIVTNASEAQVAMNPRGDALIVGTVPVSFMKRSGVWAKRYSVEEGWGELMRVEANLANSGHPRVAIDARGPAIVSWEQYRLGQRSIWAALYQPTSK